MGRRTVIAETKKRVIRVSDGGPVSVPVPTDATDRKKADERRRVVRFDGPTTGAE